MAKLKRASAQVEAPRDAVEAGLFLHRLGEAVRARALIEAALDEQVAALKKAAAADVLPHDAAVDRMTRGLQAWAEGNRALLTRDGAVKTVKLDGGEVGWRLRPPSVKITGSVEAMVETLLAAGLGQFVRIKPAIDKEAMLAEPAKAIAVPGVTIGSAGEEFVVTLDSAELAQVAA